MLIEERFVLFHVPGQTQQEAIEQVIQRASEQGRVSSVKEVTAAVLQREQESSTGFGKGIAIPHGKSVFVTEPTLLFARLIDSVEWNAMDGAPVNTLFVILVPESSHATHLQILAKLARKLMHNEFVDQLAALQTPVEVTTFIRQELA